MKKLFLILLIAFAISSCTTTSELPISVKGEIINIMRTDSTLTIVTAVHAQGDVTPKMEALLRGEKVDFDGQKFQVIKQGTTSYHVYIETTFKTK